MKILLDENVPLELKEYLKVYNTIHILFTNLRGASDEAVFKYAQRNKMLIITFDKDFLDERFY